MDDRTAELANAVEDRGQVSDSEVGQRGSVAWAGTALMEAETKAVPLDFPAGTCIGGSRRQLHTKHASPEAAGTVRVVGRKLDQRRGHGVSMGHSTGRATSQTRMCRISRCSLTSRYRSRRRWHLGSPTYQSVNSGGVALKKCVGSVVAVAAVLGIVVVGSGCGSSSTGSGAEAQQSAARRQAYRLAAHRRAIHARQARREAAHRRAKLIAARELRARQAEERQQKALERERAEEQEIEEEASSEESECDPNYSGACLKPNVSDYDCEGGSGNGPYYTGEVTVVGVDHYELDADGDGVGCESE